MSVQHRKRALAAVATISILWGTTWLPSKLVVTDYQMPPIQTGSIRFTLAGILFLTYFFIKGYTLPTLKQFGKLLVLSFFFLALSNGLTLQGLSYPGMSSGIGSVVGATVPLWVALFSIFILKKQKISLQVIIGLILGFGGIAIIFAEDLVALMNPKPYLMQRKMTASTHFTV
jgi:drug/metabolite transporter (DMT)-like permease